MTRFPVILRLIEQRQEKNDFFQQRSDYEKRTSNRIPGIEQAGF